MKEKKFRYEGNEYTESQLRDAYGDRYDDVVNSGKFELVETEHSPNNETYIYEGNEYSDSQLRDAYGDRYDDVIASGKFKKKEEEALSEDLSAPSKQPTEQPSEHSFENWEADYRIDNTVPGVGSDNTNVSTKLTPEQVEEGEKIQDYQYQFVKARKDKPALESYVEYLNNSNDSELIYHKTKKEEGDYTEEDEYRLNSNAVEFKVNALANGIKKSIRDIEVNGDNDGSKIEQVEQDVKEYNKSLLEAKDLIKKYPELYQEQLDLEKMQAKKDAFYSAIPQDWKIASTVADKVSQTTAKFAKDILTIPRTFSFDSEYGWTDILAENVTKFTDDIINKAGLMSSTNQKKEVLEAVPVLDSEGNEVIGEDGKPITETKFNSEAMFASSVGLVADMAPMFLMAGGVTSGLKALGASANASSKIGMFSSVMAQTHNNAYEEALRSGATGAQASAVALQTSAAIGAVNLLNPMEKIYTGRASAKEYAKLLLGGKEKSKAAKELLKNMIFEGSEESLEVPVQAASNYMLNQTINTNLPTDVDGMEMSTSFMLGSMGGMAYAPLNSTSSTNISEAFLESIKNKESFDKGLVSLTGKKIMVGNSEVTLTQDIVDNFKENHDKIYNKFNSIKELKDIPKESESDLIQLLRHKTNIEERISNGVDGTVKDEYNEILEVIDGEIKNIYGGKKEETKKEVIIEDQNKGYSFEYKSESEIPSELKGIEPISRSEVKVNGEEKIRLTYSGKQLIDSGIGVDKTETIAEYAERIEKLRKEDEDSKVTYSMNKTDKRVWSKDFEIIDNREGQQEELFDEEGNPTSDKWWVRNKVTGEIVTVSTKKDAKNIIDNAPAEAEMWGDGEKVYREDIISESTIVEETKTEELSKEEKKTSQDQSGVGTTQEQQANAETAPAEEQEVITQKERKEAEKGNKQLAKVSKGKSKLSSVAVLFKGLGGKAAPNGAPINAHAGANGLFFSADESTAKDYDRGKGMSAGKLPAGTTVEVIEVDPKGKKISEYRAEEVEAINNSDAQVVKLITRDGKIKAGQSRNQVQYIIKDKSLLPKKKNKKSSATKKGSDTKNKTTTRKDSEKTIEDEINEAEALLAEIEIEARKETKEDKDTEKEVKEEIKNIKAKGKVKSNILTAEAMSRFSEKTAQMIANNKAKYKQLIDFVGNNISDISTYIKDNIDSFIKNGTMFIDSKYRELIESIKKFAKKFKIAIAATVIVMSTSSTPITNISQDAVNYATEYVIPEVESIPGYTKVVMHRLGLYSPVEQEVKPNLEKATEVEVVNDAPVITLPKTTQLDVIKEERHGHGDISVHANHFSNDTGMTYNPVPAKGNSSAPEKIEGDAIAHFFIVDGISKMDGYKDIYDATQKDLIKMSNWFKSKGNFKRAGENEWFPIFKKNADNSVTVKYKQKKDIGKNDAVIQDLTQFKYQDIDWDNDKRVNKLSQYASIINSSNTFTLRWKDSQKEMSSVVFTSRELYSQFSGAAGVFIGKGADGKTYVKDFSGSVNSMLEGLDVFAKSIGANKNDITFGFYDAGSVTAKPAGKNGELTRSEWYDFNKKSFSGSGLALTNIANEPETQKNDSKKESGTGGLESMLVALAAIRRKRKNGQKITQEDVDALKAEIEEAKMKAEGRVDGDNNEKRISTPEEAKSNIQKAKDWIKKMFYSARNNKNETVYQSDKARMGEISAALTKAERTISDLNRVAKKEGVTDEEIDLVLRGEEPSSTLPKNTREVVQSMRNQIDSLTKEALKLGLVEDKFVEKYKENIGSYLTRSYRAFDSDNWSSKVSEQVRNKAFNFLKKESRKWFTENYKQNVKNFTKEELEKDLDTYIDNKLDEMISDKDSFSGGLANIASISSSNFKSRKDIPIELRNFLGEYTDPGQNYAKSVFKMANMVANGKFLQKIKEQGKGKFIFEENDPKRPRGFNKKIAGDNSKTMSPLNGMYTSQEIIDALKVAKNESPEWLNALVKGMGYVKYAKTILSYGTHMKNILGNTGFLLMNGNVTHKEFISSMKSVLEGNGFSRKGSKWKIENARAFREKYYEYQRLGVVSQSTGLGEIRSLMQTIDLDKFAFNGKSKVSQGRVSKVIAFVKNRGKKFLSNVENAYQAEDDFFKVFAFENEMTKQAQAYYGKDKSKLTESEYTELSQNVADMIRDTYPAYDMVPKIVHIIKRFPLLGTFVSFEAESMRVLKNSAAIAYRQLRSDNPEVKKLGAKRLAGASAYVTLKYGAIALAAQMVGMDDDDDEAVRQFVPPWMKNGSLMYVYNDDGVIGALDINASDPYGSTTSAVKVLYDFVEGVPKGNKKMSDADEAMIESFKEQFSTFISADILVKSIDQWANNKNEFGNPIYNEELGDVEKYSKFVEHFYKTFEPGSIKSVSRYFDPSKDLTTELVASFLGMRVYEVDVRKQFKYSLIDYKDRLNNAKKPFTKEKYNEDSDLDSMDEAMKKSNEPIVGILEEIRSMYEAAVELDVPEEELNKMFKDVKFNSDYRRQIIRGYIKEDQKLK